MNKYIFYLMEQMPFPKFQLLESEILNFLFAFDTSDKLTKSKKGIFKYFLQLHHSKWAWNDLASSTFPVGNYMMQNSYNNFHSVFDKWTKFQLGNIFTHFRVAF